MPGRLLFIACSAISDDGVFGETADCGTQCLGSPGIIGHAAHRLVGQCCGLRWYPVRYELSVGIEAWTIRVVGQLRDRSSCTAF